MIESNINNVAAAATRQDVRSVQGQREANTAEVTEQASSNPMASSGVETADSSVTAVSSQPAGVVTRLGETTEQVPLYEANRPTGSIIRPAIEVAENARQTPTTEDVNEQVAQQRQDLDETLVVQGRPSTVAASQDTSFNDMQKLV
ncbi:hypothetical protein [Marinospirillum insulare]|uniref:SprA-related family protein n=1 Tax=Marinospirillum insulare TaxID=217169 RepID=A0ABQ5ZXV4_9GAMM|nr:hypothetical protein [Marinospirillum insulare]GLR64316.1 hypothetical protein GCM10007878_17540 [Marinospirillum insulare]